MRRVHAADARRVGVVHKLVEPVIGRAQIERAKEGRYRGFGLIAVASVPIVRARGQARRALPNAVDERQAGDAVAACAGAIVPSIAKVGVRRAAVPRSAA